MPGSAAPSRYLAQPLISINGAPVQPRLMEDVVQVLIEESLSLPAAFSLILNNPYGSGYSQDTQAPRPWFDDANLKIGQAISFGFKSSTTEDSAFQKDSENTNLLEEAEITGIEASFLATGNAPIVLRGYDVSHRLHRGRFNRSFQNVKDGDLVRQIASESGISKGKIDDGGGPYEYVFQENQTNMEFLRMRAARLGFEVYVQNKQLHFHAPEQQSSLQLQWLTDIQSFQVRVSSAQQVAGVEVHGWDYANKKKFFSEKKAPAKVITSTKHGQGNRTSSAFKGKPTEPKMVIVDQPVWSPKEADTMAQAVCDELGGEFVFADAKGPGNPQIQPGRVIKLNGMGPYDGSYYVTETRHLYQGGIYSTEFSVRGLRGGNLFSVLASQTRARPGQTLMVGIVTDNKDPKDWGRVKVMFPTLTDGHTSNWARVIQAGAGPGRGFDCLPEVNDEVLVGFEHGDIHRPYIIGNVWNGKDNPPTKVADSVGNKGVRLRTFKTRTGHTLQFVEEDNGGSKAGVYVTTSGGHNLRISDGDHKVEIETKGGHILTLDDSAAGSISMSSTGSISIKADTSIDIRANANITINGAMIMLN
jgi:uncharacterized protein involved in type VI secretion and phage assembly